jgi:hypothetical protein
VREVCPRALWRAQTTRDARHTRAARRRTRWIKRAAKRRRRRRRDEAVDDDVTRERARAQMMSKSV